MAGKEAKMTGLCVCAGGHRCVAFEDCCPDYFDLVSWGRLGRV